MEPLSIVAISGAVGGIAGKFAEKVWGLGEKWLSDYLRGHAPKAQEKAQQNALDFLSELAQRVKELEKQTERHGRVIEDSLGDPGFSVLLQKAIISSAETSDKQKHELLARLVSHRLTTQSETPFALSSKSACDAVSALNIKQLKILGLLANIFSVKPGSSLFSNVPKQMRNVMFHDWLIKRLQVYENLTYTQMDLLHLESLSCVKWDPIVSRDLQKIFDYTKESGFTFDQAAFSSTDTGKKIVRLWEAGLKQTIPTTVGALIGVYVADMLTSTTTVIEGWWVEA